MLIALLILSSLKKTLSIIKKANIDYMMLQVRNRNSLAFAHLTISLAASRPCQFKFLNHDDEVQRNLFSNNCTTIYIYKLFPPLFIVTN